MFSSKEKNFIFWKNQFYSPQTVLAVNDRFYQLSIANVSFSSQFLLCNKRQNTINFLYKRPETLSEIGFT